MRSECFSDHCSAVDGQGGDAAIAAALADGNAAGAARGEDEPRDLRRSVTTLLDAMQNLIRGLQLPGVPHDAELSMMKMSMSEVLNINS